MNFLDISNLIDDNDITSIEFTKNGFTVKFRKSCQTFDSRLYVSYIATLICEDKILLSYNINIYNGINRRFGSKEKPLYIYNIDTITITPTEVSLHINRFDEMISRISEMELYTKIVMINNINQLIADYGFDFTMICEYE